MEREYIKEFLLRRNANESNVFLFETSDPMRIKEFILFVLTYPSLKNFVKLSFNVQTNTTEELTFDPSEEENEGIVARPFQPPQDSLIPFGPSLLSLLPTLRQSYAFLIISYVYLQQHSQALTDFLMVASQDQKLYNRKSTVIVFCRDAELFPEALRNLSGVISITPSTPEERKEILTATVQKLSKSLKRELNIPVTEELVAASSGLTLHEVETAALKSVLLHGTFTVEGFTDYKVKLLRDAGLEFSLPQRGFESVGGYDYIKTYVRTRITLLRKPELAKYYGLPIPKGFLLFGPPGTGKSWLAKALAKEAGLPVVTLDPSTFLRGIVGETESRVKRVVRIVESLAPVICFIDEFDQLTMSRSSVMSTDSGVSRRMTNMLLSWLGDENRRAFIVGATNFVTDIDPAFLRPGRLDEVIPVFYPDKEARYEILKVHTSVIRKVPLAKDVDLNALAARTEFFTGAELEKLVIEAAMCALESNAEKISQDHFDEALKSIQINIAERQRTWKNMILQLKKLENVNARFIRIAEEIEEKGGDRVTSALEVRL